MDMVTEMDMEGTEVDTVVLGMDTADTEEVLAEDMEVMEGMGEDMEGMVGMVEDMEGME